MAYNDMSFRTPWKIIASVAGVIGNNFILSMDYEWVAYNKMKFSAPGSYGINDDWGYDWDYGWDWYAPGAPSTTKAPTRSFGYDDDMYGATNGDIENYYQSTNTIRLGAEYRVTPAFSLRAGYSYTTSPVKQGVRDDKEVIYTAGTRPNYRFDNHTYYITCGAGYRYQNFYVDLAYVYKNISSQYHAYTPDINLDVNQAIPSPQSKVNLNNSQIVLSAGFRF